jgi:hypothetical protein
MASAKFESRTRNVMVAATGDLCAVPPDTDELST